MPDAAALNALLLCDRPPRVADTVRDHIDALSRLPGFRVRVAAVFGDAPAALDFDRFDVVILHYTLVLAHDAYVSPALRARLAASRALKAVFIQDEYRHIDRTVDAMRAIGIGVLFTCMPDPSIEDVYPSAKLPGVRKVPVLTGYVPAGLLTRPVVPLAGRPVDVGYRARKVPAWLGDLGQEKWAIGQRFRADAPRYGLTCDISYREEERLYGEAWIAFQQRCKAILGVESGSSVFDFTGDLQATVDAHAAAHPEAGYAELKQRYFAAEDGRINQRQISPRCFEAAALGTLMILYEGHYSGVLVPWRHYIPLRKDHANMDAVVATLRDPEKSRQIASRAYLEVARNPEYSFSTHAGRVAAVLKTEVTARGRAFATPYSDAEFSAVKAPPRRTRRALLARNVIVYGHYVFFNRLLGGVSEARRDRITRWLQVNMRPLIRRARQFFSHSTNR